MSGFADVNMDEPNKEASTNTVEAEVGDDELVEGRDFEVVVDEDEQADQALLNEMAKEEEDDDIELAPEEEAEEGGEPEVVDSSRTSFKAHTDSVYSVAITKDGKFVVSGGGDDVAVVTQLNVDNQDAPAQTLRLSGHTDTVVQVALNHDESLIASASYDGTVKVWESNSGKLLHTLDGPSSEIEWVVWHPVGDVILAGSADATAWMWNARNGQCMSVFAGHEATLTCGRFTLNGKRILTGSLDASLRMWDPKTGQCIHTFSGHGFHEFGVVSLALHHDQPMVAVGGQDGTVRVARLDTKKIIGTFRHSTKAFNPTVAGAGEEEGEEEAPPSVEAVAFCQSQPWMVSGGTDGVIKVWDLNTGNCRFGFTQHTESIVKIEPVGNGTLMVSCSMDGTLRLWDSRSGQQLQIMSGHSDAVLDFGVVQDMVVSASDDNTCKVFELVGL